MTNDRRIEAEVPDLPKTPVCVIFAGGLGDEPCWCGVCEDEPDHEGGE